MANGKGVDVYMYRGVAGGGVESADVPDSSDKGAEK